MDRWYLDFERLHRFTDEAAFFVTHTKKGIQFRRRTSHPVDFATGLVSDHIVGLATALARRDYPDQLRRVRYRDPQTTKRLTFLTNNFTLPALAIPQLYKSRWAVELFFRWIKQHLRIKAFYGTSENAVKTQIWIALSVYVLVAIVKKRLTLDVSLYKLLQILSVTLFDKTPISIAVFDIGSQFGEIDDGNQLPLFAITAVQIGRDWSLTPDDYLAIWLGCCPNTAGSNQHPLDGLRRPRWTGEGIVQPRPQVTIDEQVHA